MLRNILAKDLAMLLVCAAADFAQPPQEGPRPAAPGAQAPTRQEEKGKEDKKPPEEKVSQTKHTIQIGGKAGNCMATAGTMLLKKEDGTATASIFYIASVISWMTGFTCRWCGLRRDCLDRIGQNVPGREDPRPRWIANTRGPRQPECRTPESKAIAVSAGAWVSVVAGAAVGTPTVGR